MSKYFPALAALMFAAASAVAIPVSFDLSRVANKDVVYEAGGHGSAEPFGGNPNGLHCFGEDGFVDGFPQNRYVPSSQEDLGNYVLLRYDQPNVVELCTHSSVEPQTYVIDIPDHVYSKLGLLVSSVDGDSSFTIRLQYKDGTTDFLWWEADDWYDLGPRGNLEKALRELDRVDAESGMAEDSDHFHVYEFVLDEERGLKTDKELVTIAIGTDPNRWPEDQLRFGGVFAINGAAVEP